MTHEFKFRITEILEDGEYLIVSVYQKGKFYRKRVYKRLR